MFFKVQMVCLKKMLKHLKKKIKNQQTITESHFNTIF